MANQRVDGTSVHSRHQSCELRPGSGGDRVLAQHDLPSSAEVASGESRHYLSVVDERRFSPLSFINFVILAGRGIYPRVEVVGCFSTLFLLYQLCVGAELFVWFLLLLFWVFG